MPVAQVGSYEIHYVEQGSEFPVVLIHGLAGDHTAWAAPMESWSRDHRVLAFDNRGAGRSLKPPGPYTIEQLADDAAAVVRALAGGAAAAPFPMKLISQGHFVGNLDLAAGAYRLTVNTAAPSPTLSTAFSFKLRAGPGVRD